METAFILFHLLKFSEILMIKLYYSPERSFFYFTFSRTQEKSVISIFINLNVCYWIISTSW